MMKRMKRLLCTVLVLLLLFSVVAGYSAAYAEAPSRLIGETVRTTAGETVNFSVSLQQRELLCSFLIRLTYDADALTLVEQGEDGNNLYCARGNFSNKGTMLSTQKTNGICEVMWFHTADVTAEGTLFTVQFKVNETAEERAYPISVTYSAKDTLRNDEELISFECVDGQIDVEAFAPTIYGDAVKVQDGQIFEYPVYIQDNPGLEGFRAYLIYDSAVFAPVVEDGEPICTFAPGFSSGNGVCSSFASGCQVLWYNTSPTTVSGQAFTIQLAVKEKAVHDAYPITVGYMQGDTICDEAPIIFDTRNGSIIVGEMGDTNGDNTIDIQDMQNLFDYLATGHSSGNVNGDHFELFSDINYDGAVNILDYQALYMLLQAIQQDAGTDSSQAG